MIEIGKYNELHILKSTSVGLYLADDEHDEEVLLPNKYCSEIGDDDDKVEVFIYRDSRGRKVATTLRPKLTLDEIEVLTVSAVSDVGAFLDWGLDKDLFVPFNEQKPKMVEGENYIIYLDLDEETDRLFGSAKLDKYLHNEFIDLEANEEVDLMIYRKTELGYSVIVNGEHLGLIYDNEIFKELTIGEKVKGYVKKVRTDRKIDLSLQPLGYTNSNDANAEMIYKALVANNGALELNDKSSPDAIYAKFGISKKAFKRSVGALYKERKITIESDGIKLIS